MRPTQEPLFPTHNDALPGEDRSLGGKALYVDLIPASCWFKNVRTGVHRADWDGLRRYVYSRADNRCEICNATGTIHAHERWVFDDSTSTQRLARIIALCAACHEATHYGFATISGRAQAAFAHIAAVNGWSVPQTHALIAKAHEAFVARSAREWNLDLSILIDLGIRLTRGSKAAA